jgi:hypothetical protein
LKTRVSITEGKVYEVVTSFPRHGRFYKVSLTEVAKEIGCSYDGLLDALSRFVEDGFMKKNSFTSRGTYISFLRNPTDPD